MPEIMGAGAAFLDYDDDGDLDIYLVQSGCGNRLYRQEDGKTFHDVTEEAGVSDAGYGMGAAVGDIDNDGDVDLYVTNYGPDVRYRNEGSGRFREVTEEMGIEGESPGARTARIPARSRTRLTWRPRRAREAGSVRRSRGALQGGAFAPSGPRVRDHQPRERAD